MTELGIVYRNIPRCDPEIVAQLGQISSATLHEAQGRTGNMQPYMRPAWAGARCYGSAVTVLAQPGDNWMLHVVVEQCQPGDVVVVGLTSPNDDGMFGDLLATSFQARGIHGLIIDAGVRDSDELRQMGFAVFSKAISIKGCIKATLGSVNIPVVCAGALVHPGDIIVGDGDGVVVIPRQNAQSTLQAALARESLEQEKRAKLAAGILGLDMYNMRPQLQQAGLKYVD